MSPGGIFEAFELWVYTGGGGVDRCFEGVIFLFRACSFLGGDWVGVAVAGNLLILGLCCVMNSNGGELLDEGDFINAADWTCNYGTYDYGFSVV